MSETALALVQSITAVEFFKPGASKTVIESLKIEVRAQAAKLDISTEDGRKDIASLAFKVAKSKTGLDKAGKELVADQKAAIKRIDAERATVWDELEALQKEVRQPLTDFENAEKARIDSHEAALAALVESGAHVERNWQAMSVEDMRGRLAEITNSQRDWQEFLARARQACATTIGQIKTSIAQRDRLDADAAELEALRAAAAVQAQKDRDAQIAREAREAAEASARERAAEQAREAEKERQRVELERAEAEARAKQAEAQRAQEAAAAEEAKQRHAEKVRAAEEETRAAIAKAQQDAVDAAKRHAENLEALRLKAEGEKRVADEKREREAKEAEERAELSRKEAVEAERMRIEAERQAEADRIAEETRKREANRKHAAKINNEAKHAIAATCDLTDEQALRVVEAIAKGLILHTKISY